MTINMLISAFGLFLVGLSIYRRRRKLRKSAHWIELMGVVDDFKHKIVGEGTVVYVDVHYSYQDKNIRSFNLDTGGDSSKNFQIGTKLPLLVDPENPSIARIKDKTMLDGILSPRSRSLDDIESKNHG